MQASSYLSVLALAKKATCLLLQLAVLSLTGCAVSHKVWTLQGDRIEDRQFVVERVSIASNDVVGSYVYLDIFLQTKNKASLQVISTDQADYNPVIDKVPVGAKVSDHGPYVYYYLKNNFNQIPDGLSCALRAIDAFGHVISQRNCGDKFEHVSDSGLDFSPEIISDQDTPLKYLKDYISYPKPFFANSVDNYGSSTWKIALDGLLNSLEGPPESIVLAIYYKGKVISEGKITGWHDAYILPWEIRINGLNNALLEHRKRIGKLLSQKKFNQVRRHLEMLEEAGLASADHSFYFGYVDYHLGRDSYKKHLKEYLSNGSNNEAFIAQANKMLSSGLKIVDTASFNSNSQSIDVIYDDHFTPIPGATLKYMPIDKSSIPPDSALYEYLISDTSECPTVVNVKSGTWAHRVGFQAGDVIDSVNSRDVCSPGKLEEVMRSMRKDKFPLAIMRNFKFLALLVDRDEISSARISD